MTEGLFILTTIFVAYIVYAIIDEQKTTAKSKAPAAKPEAQAAAEKQAKPQVAVAKEKPAVNKPVAAKTVAPKAEATKAAPAKPAVTKAAAPAAPKAAAKPEATKAKPAAAKKATAAAASAPSAGLKDPKTGEVATAYSNYRFTKRWIKDALVAEGLLDKVYTANELNAETDAKIKTAIAKLEAMSKYKA
ncbi:MAG: hypothetical protein Q8L15_20260 [Methylobacter sp.]|nr:hypothetical protein [Methylobacter sp.]